MARKLAWMMAGTSLVWGGLAHALGLGEIEVKSYLNQPLSAVIPVSSANPAELDSLTVELAGNEAFERAGLERPEYLSSLRFEVKGSTIVVRSKDPAREPFVSFLLDVRWGGGRLLREYTVLLDPPTLVQKQPAPRHSAAEVIVQQAPSRAEQPPATPPRAQAPAATEPAPTPPSAVPAQEKKAAPPPSYAGKTYGPVGAKETLWSIAYRLRPDLSLTMDQMQVAIFNANPKAFEDGRLTGLMKGAMLRIPDVEEIRAVDAAHAKVLVAEARRGPAAPVAKAAPAEPAPAEPAALRPAPAEAVIEPAPKTPVPETEAAPPPPESAPAVSEQPADGEQIAEAPAADTPVPAESAPTETPAPSLETQPAPAAQPAQPQIIEERSLVADLLERGRSLLVHPLFIPAAAGFVVLLGLVLVVNGLRNKLAQRAYAKASRREAAPAATAPTLEELESAAEPASRPLQDTFESTAVGLRAPSATQTRPGPAETQEAVATGQQTLQQTQVQEPAAASTGGRKLDFDVTGNFANETVQINLEAGDPLSEAEFHRAYGLYDEAALLLRQALDKDPNRTDARVKLAEIYFEAGKGNEFVGVARDLKGRLSVEEWQKIALLGSQIVPDSELFKGAAAQVGGSVDLSFDEPAAAPAPAPASARSSAPKGAAPAPAVAGGGDVLDFKLEDMQLPETPAAPASPAAAAPAAAGDALEFDLDSLSFDVPQATSSSPPAATAAGGEELKLDLGDFDLKLDAPAAPVAAAGGETVEISSEPAADLPIAEGDESSTKLDLARAYIDMGDADMAKNLLNEVLRQGDAEQKKEAQELLKRVPA